jgi:phospholipid/cholesterol/gamma-HCH transport system substrate-binding protein
MTRRDQVGWAQVKIGLLVMAALGFLIVMIMNLEEGLGLFARQTKFKAMVTHTQGLKIGGPVRMNGVDIGNVHMIAIAGETPHVEIIFTVKSDVAPHIREDASVSIRALGLLGDKFLEISPGTLSKPSLKPGAVLMGKAEMDIGSLASGASTTIEKVNTALDEVQQALAAITKGQGTTGKLVNDPELYNRSKEVLDKINQASEKSLALLDKVERGEGTVGKLISDKELYARATQAVRELNDLAKKLNNENGTLAKLSDPTLYAKLDNLTTRGEQLLNKVERGEGTVGKLVTSDQLYARADKLLAEVEEFVADVKKNPKKYFKFSVF